MLRALGTKIPPLVRNYENLCLGNNYTTTLHVLCTAIVKLGKVVPVNTVYRAPGGALPASFWCKQPEGVQVWLATECVAIPCAPPNVRLYISPHERPDGMCLRAQGGMELAFMSTTTAKAEAMAYAKRAPGMLLFEIQQGFVARGASISWLSQYPNEEEVLFPPLTTLEVVGSRVEGCVVIVELRPCIKAPGTLKCGAYDIVYAAKARERALREKEDAEAAALAEKRKAKELQEVKQRQIAWQQRMAEVRLAASRRQGASTAAKLAETAKAQRKAAWKRAVDSQASEREQASLMEQLQKAERDAAAAEAEAADKADLLRRATEAEARALKMKQDAERKAGQRNWKLARSYGEAEYMKAVVRAKNLAAAKAEHDLTLMEEKQQEVQSYEAAAPAAAPSGEYYSLDANPAASAKPEKPKAEEGEKELPPAPVEELGFAWSDKPPHARIELTSKVDAVMATQKLLEVVGPQERWVEDGIRDDDMEMAERCFQRIAEQCSLSKKWRSRVVEEGFFEATAKCLLKYEDVPDRDERAVLMRFAASVALASLAQKASSEGIQDKAQVCLSQLAFLYDFNGGWASDALQNLTIDHQDNTFKILRAGGLVPWLHEDSRVMLPEPLSTYFGNKKSKRNLKIKNPNKGAKGGDD